MSAKVKNLFLKAEKGQPMVSVAAAESVAGFGIRGDVSYGRRSRQVLLIDLETLADFDLAAGDVRENITTRGLDFGTLATGSRLRIGSVVLELNGLCSPCHQMDDLRPGLRQAIEGRRGMLARVLEGGSITLGDPITVESRIEDSVAPDLNRIET